MTVDCDKNISNACQVWSRQIEKNAVAVVLYNAGDDSHNITVLFNQIPYINWNNTVNLQLRDLWQHKDLGSYSNKYTTEIQPHGVQFITLTQQ